MSDSAKLRIVYGVLLLIGGLLLFTFVIVSIMLVIFSVFIPEIILVSIVAFITSLAFFNGAKDQFYRAGKVA